MKRLLLAALIIASPAAQAGNMNCTSFDTGYTTCSGFDSNGESRSFDSQTINGSTFFTERRGDRVMTGDCSSFGGMSSCTTQGD